MAESWAAFHGAREVLAFCAGVALFAVEAQAGAAARCAFVALLAVGADAGAAARRAKGALLAVEAEAGAATRRASGAPLAVEADAGAAARLTIVALRAVRTPLPNVAPDWVRVRGGVLPELLQLPPGRNVAAKCVCQFGRCL